MLKILTPTDFSDIAEYGLQVARDIALNTEAEIYLVNYVAPPKDSYISTTGDVAARRDIAAEAFTIELTKKNSLRIHDLAEKYQSDQVAIKPVIEVDDFKHAINKFVEEKDIDLIVMGTSGESTFEELFFGNHTEQVIRNVKRPTLAVKKYQERFAPSSFALAVDLDTEGREELEYFKDFSEWLQVRVHFVHVTRNGKNTERAVEKMKAEAEKIGFKDFTIDVRTGGNKEEALRNFISEKGADFVAVTSRARTGLANLFLGSFSEDMVKDASVPALVLPVQR